MTSRIALALGITAATAVFGLAMVPIVYAFTGTGAEVGPMVSACHQAVADELAPRQVIRFVWDSATDTSVRGEVEARTPHGVLPDRRAFICSMSRPGGTWVAVAALYDPGRQPAA